MQPYDPRPHAAHPSYPAGSRLDGFLPGGDGSPGSETPIYDSLYAEYSRLFRSLPGDRHGEEELRFVGFDTVRGTGTGRWSSGSWVTEQWHAARRLSGRVPAALPPGQRDGHAYGH